MIIRRLRTCLLMLLTLGAAAASEEDPADRFRDLAVRGEVVGENLTFSLRAKLETTRADCRVELVAGDLVLATATALPTGGELRYDAGRQGYDLLVPHAGIHAIDITFAVRAAVLAGEDIGWRESVFAIPASRLRQLELVCDRTDLEVTFPGALRQESRLEDGKQIYTAVLGPGKPFAVRWKPVVRALDSKLVFSGEINAIASCAVGAVHLDSLALFRISQGKLERCRFVLPAGLSVTAVRGDNIQDWTVGEGADGSHELTVVLNRPQTGEYCLQIESEKVLPAFPAEAAVPVIGILDAARVSGNICIGTDSAIQLLVDRMAGLTQVDLGAFPRVLLANEFPRTLPTAKAFCYAFATGVYDLTLRLADIVPAYDSVQRLTLAAAEDDLVVTASIDLDVRDAALRELVLHLPVDYVVSDVTGHAIAPDTFTSRQVTEASGSTWQMVTVPFIQPVLGRTLVELRMERGRSPVGQLVTFDGLAVVGARNQRGYLVLAAETGIEIGVGETTGLRRVNVGSVPERVATAQRAFRFREAGWSLEVDCSKRQAGVRAEAFHLMTVGDGIAYGSVVVNYIITGAPVDELSFEIPAELTNVEFVSADDPRTERRGSSYRVKLRRKVTGNYNLGITFNQRLEEDGGLLIGAVACSGVETVTGYVVLASKRNLHLASEPLAANVVAINREELPAQYRLLIASPVLAGWKYVDRHTGQRVSVRAFEQSGGLPAIVELMDVTTRMVVAETGEVQDVTRVTYKVKNHSAQYLVLDWPAGAESLGARLVETGEPLSVIRDGDQLKIPLARTRNPNQPKTILLEFGRSHGILAGGNRVELGVPASVVRTSFVNWRVEVDGDKALLPVGGNLTVTDREADGGLGASLASAARAWSWAWHNVGSFLGLLVAFVAALLLGGALVAWRGSRVLPLYGLGLLLGLVTWLGVLAAGAPPLAILARSVDFRTVTYSQALEQAPRIVLAVVPAWRQHVTVFGSVLVPVFGLALLITALVFRRRRFLRALLVAGGIAALASGCHTLPSLRPLVGHLLTWVLPAVALALVAFAGRQTWRVRALSGGRGPAHVAATLPFVVLLLTYVTTMVSCGDAIRPTVTVPIIREIQATLSAEKDTMAVSLHLDLHAVAPASIPLLEPGVVALSEERVAQHLRLIATDGQHRLVVERAGDYGVDLEFLVPLPPADENQVRRFVLPLPIALTNRVQLRVTEPGMDIRCPTAIRYERVEDTAASAVAVIVGPGQQAVFDWRPRAREVDREHTTVYSEVLSLQRFDSGVVEGRHRIDYQVAQGAMNESRLSIPAGMTVTAVAGDHLGTWRFDPKERELLVRFGQGLTGAYRLLVHTQMPAGSLPAAVSVAPLSVVGARNQRGRLGLVVSPAVYLELGKHPPRVNVDDFTRAATDLLSSLPGGTSQVVRHAFRTHGTGDRTDDTLALTLMQVTPEIRVTQDAAFQVTDERLIHTARLALDISKAGLFAVHLGLPSGYDIDALSAPEISHWDEIPDEDGVSVVVHFRSRVQGTVQLDLALSQPVSELPAAIAVPRIDVRDALKHGGIVRVAANRGVRLLVEERDGVSELDPVDLDPQRRNDLVFKLLRPVWQVRLGTEVIKPVIHVDTLHVAKVSEGLVRHAHYLRWRLQHAGSKHLTVAVPAAAMGLVVTGPDIARWSVGPAEEGVQVVDIELTKKYFETVYPLQVTFETHYDRGKGTVALPSVWAHNVDLQRGHVVVFATERVELVAGEEASDLQVAEARTIPADFGAGDQSAAAFCYVTLGHDYHLTLTAKRHEMAGTREAEVQSTQIETLLTAQGATINRVRMQLTVGSKQRLAVRLPPQSEVWTLMVNRGAIRPSRDDGERDLFYVPLAHTASGELQVEVEFIYQNRLDLTLYGPCAVPGPTFDLPLKDVEWSFYLPERYEYGDFGGDLGHVVGATPRSSPQVYSVIEYDRQVEHRQQEENSQAKKLADQGVELAVQGQQYAARNALEQAYSYSFNDADLNADALVQLQTLNRRQAVVGLASRRGHLWRANGMPEQAAKNLELDENFTEAQARRLEGSLTQDDSRNLEMICDRLVQVQHTAAGAAVQIQVEMPRGGRCLTFRRSLQVKPDAPMTVRFTALPQGRGGNGLGAVGIAVIALVLLLLTGFSGRIWVAAVVPTTTSDADTFADTDTEVEIGCDPNAVEDLLYDLAEAETRLPSSADEDASSSTIDTATVITTPKNPGEDRLARPVGEETESNEGEAEAADDTPL